MPRAGLIAEVASVRRGRVSARILLERAAVPLLLASIVLALVWAPWIPPLCPSRRIFHVPCPSCGLTRAARLALVGEWGAATRMHPLWLVVLPYLGLVGVGECAGHVRDGRWGRWAGHRATKWAGLCILVALVVVWVARQWGAFGGPVAI